MRHRNKLVWTIFVLVCLCFSPTGWAHDLKLASDWVRLEPGQSFSVDIIADDLTNLSGVVVSINYPADTVDLDAVPVTTGYFTDGMWQAQAAPGGVLYLAGLQLDANGPGANEKVFSVHLRVKDTVTSAVFAVSLDESRLCNGPAGWGKDVANNGQYDKSDGDKYESAPILYSVTSPEDTDVLLEKFKRDPQLRFKVYKERGNGGSNKTSAVSGNDAGVNTENQAPLAGTDEPKTESDSTNPIFVLKNPSDQTFDVVLNPVLEIVWGSDRIPAGDDLSMVWQISRDINFTDLVFEATGPAEHTTKALSELILDGQAAYFWRATCIRGLDQSVIGSASASFTTGMADTVDLDANGISDTQDVSYQNNKILQQHPDIDLPGLKVLSDDEGKLQMGLLPADSSARINRAKWLDPDALSVKDKDASQVTYSNGLLAFQTNVSAPGATAGVTLYCSKTIRSTSVWRSYDVKIGAFSDVAAATLSRDRRSIVLQLTDGGAGDADGVANGVIVTIGGPAGK